MARQTKNPSQSNYAQVRRRDIGALPPLGPIPDGFVGYYGTQSTENSAKIIDIKKPNRLHSLVLENEKKEFVGYLTARFGVDPEVAARTYDQLSPSFNRTASTRPPEIAPEIYSERADKYEKADAFLLRVYGQWLGDTPTIFQHHVRSLDVSLAQGLNNAFKHRSDELAAIIPPKKKEVDARLGVEADALSPDERKRQLNQSYHTRKPL